MLKNITFSVEQLLIKKAREKAREQNETLNYLFGKWISAYVKGDNIVDEYQEFMSKTNYVNPGKKFSRKELNER